MSTDAQTPQTAKLSWRVGPANSRLVRVLTYLGEGWFGGALVFGAVWVGRSLVPAVASDSALFLAGGAFLVAVALRWLWFLFWQRRLARRESDLRLWVQQEWLATYRWEWVVGLTLLVGGGLVALDLLVPLRDDARRWLWWGTLFVGVTPLFAASLLSTRGELDSGALTLRTVRYGQWRELDLRTLTGVHRVALGDFVVLWLSVTPGVEKRTAKQGVYVLPASAFDAARPAIVAGLDAPVPLDDETVERAEFFRRVNRFVAAGVLALGVAFFAFSVWLGLRPVQLFGAVWGFVLFGSFLLKLAV